MGLADELEILIPVRFAETLFQLICLERKTLFRLKKQVKKRRIIREARLFQLVFFSRNSVNISLFV